MTALRLSSALASLFLLASPALAQSPAQQADALNNQGKQFFAEKRYEEAYAKFKDAATLSPEGRFFFNMCYALNFLERYEDAIQACEQVEAAGGDAELKEKTQRALASLREKQAAQQPAGGGQPDPDGGGGQPDPNAGGGQPDPNAGGGEPAGGPDPFVQGQSSAPIDSYKWSVGAELGMLGNLGASEDPFGNELYGPSGVNLRLFANFIVNDAARLGLQGYLGVGSLPPSDDNLYDEALGMFDFGGALYLHRPLAGRIYWTPLAGVHLAVRQPQELSQGFIGLGARAEVAFSYVFGAGGEHAISLTPGLNIHFPSTGEQETDFGETFDAEEYGFDQTRALFALNVGYTYRFSTPFGSTPLITLE
jgi:tetratricopeptide (TPR) repeat protein